MSYRVSSRQVVLFVVLAVGCNGNAGGCSCMRQIPDGFPAAEWHANAVQAHITAAGLARLGDSTDELVAASGLPPVQIFDVPDTCDQTLLSNGTYEITFDMCCNTVCELRLDTQAQAGDPDIVELTPRTGSGLDFHQNARVRTVASFPVRLEGTYLGVTLASANCGVTLNTETSGTDTITITVPIDLVTDPTTSNTRIEIGDPATSAPDVADFTVTSTGGTLGGFCDLAAAYAATQVADIARGLLTDFLRGTLDDQLCRPCEVDSNCAPFATCVDDRCEVDPNPAQLGDEYCLNEIGFSGRARVATALADIAPRQPGEIDIYQVSGASVSDLSGLWLGMLSGSLPVANSLDGTPHHPCVPPSIAPVPPTIVAFPELVTGGTIPGTSTPYDFGLGVHGYQLDLAAWAAYESGALCLDIDHEVVPELSSALLVPLLPSLADLLHGHTVPLRIGLRPQAPPVISIGAGTFSEVGDDVTITDPLLTMHLENAELDVYALIDQRYVRLFTAKADFTLPLVADVDQDGRLVPLTDDLDGAVSDIAVRNTELLTEAPDDIATQVEPVLALALPLLVDGFSAIEVPGFLLHRFEILPGGIQPDATHAGLLLFGALVYTPTGLTAQGIDTRARVTVVQVPPTEAFAALDPETAPRVRIALDSPGEGLEWQVRTRPGIWSPFTRDRELVLAVPWLWLQGRHPIEVRARQIGRPETLDATPVELIAIIDTLPPRLGVVAEAGALRVDADDLVTPREGLAVGYRASGDWTWAAPGATTVPQMLDGAAVTEVIVVDEVGNQEIATVDVDLTSGAGCDAGAGGAALALPLLAAFGLVSRRRRRVAPLMMLALLPGCGGCGDDPAGDVDAGDGGEDVAPGTIGRWADIAVGNGRVVVSAYDQDLGDLVVGELVDGEVAADLTYTVVDGVPDAEPTLDPGGYRGGVVEPGDDIGAWTSIALDQDAAARVAYTDVAGTELRFARETDDGWEHGAVDQTTTGTVLYASLVLGDAGIPSIAYMATVVPAGGGFVSELRWAQARSGAPTGPSDWDISVIATQPISCAGLCDAGEACVRDTGSCAIPENTCVGGCEGALACVGGACVEAVPDPEVEDLPEGTGLFASAALLPDGTATIAHHNRATAGLRLAVDDSGWSEVILHETATATAGQWASTTVSADGVVHLAYHEGTARQLLYVTWSSGAATPIERADDGLRALQRPHAVGAGAAIALDGDGRPAILYQDSDTGDLLLARRDAAGSWSHEELLTGAAAAGFFTALASDPATGALWAVSYVYDREAPELEYLSVTQLE